MKTTVVLLLLTISTSLCAQIPNVLSHEKFEWINWEEPIHNDSKIIEIELAKKIPRMDSILKTRFWTVDNFHIVDYDQDGKEDLIYEGFVGEDCDKVIFLNGDCESYKIGFEYYGELISIWRYKDLEPLCFKILDRPGCDGTTAQIESYEPSIADSSFNYQIVSKEAYVDWTIFPSKLTCNHLFNVDNHFYRLRSSPEINNEPNFDHFTYCSDGNILAEYPKNSKGTVLYKKKVLNQEWWFVLMKPNDQLENSIFHQGRNSLDDASYYGWMSGRYLTSLSE